MLQVSRTFVVEVCGSLQLENLGSGVPDDRLRQMMYEPLCAQSFAAVLFGKHCFSLLDEKAFHESDPKDLISRGRKMESAIATL